jgi:hypothetical protein
MVKMPPIQVHVGVVELYALLTNLTGLGKRYKSKMQPLPDAELWVAVNGFCHTESRKKK